jgi:hypothetical protein
MAGLGMKAGTASGRSASNVYESASKDKGIIKEIDILYHKESLYKIVGRADNLETFRWSSRRSRDEATRGGRNDGSLQELPTLPG